MMLEETVDIPEKQKDGRDFYSSMCQIIHIQSVFDGSSRVWGWILWNCICWYYQPLLLEPLSTFSVPAQPGPMISWNCHRPHWRTQVLCRVVILVAIVFDVFWDDTFPYYQVLCKTYTQCVNPHSNPWMFAGPHKEVWLLYNYNALHTCSVAIGSENPETTRGTVDNRHDDYPGIASRKKLTDIEGPNMWLAFPWRCSLKPILAELHVWV